MFFITANKNYSTPFAVPVVDAARFASTLNALFSAGITPAFGSSLFSPTITGILPGGAPSPTIQAAAQVLGAQDITNFNTNFQDQSRIRILA